MENGYGVTIGHPENIALLPENASPYFYLISARIRLCCTFDTVSGVATADSVAHLARIAYAVPMNTVTKSWG